MYGTHFMSHVSEYVLHIYICYTHVTLSADANATFRYVLCGRCVLMLLEM